MRKNKSCLRMRMSMAAAAMSALASFAADPVVWEGSTNLTMTANTTVDVPTGTTNVIDTLGGAYTLTKTGGGVLEVRLCSNTSTKIVVAEGLVRFANPRPDDIFAQAVYHVDASDLSSIEYETVNGTNFVTRWNDTDGRTEYYATPSMSERYGRIDPANRKPFFGQGTQNGLPYVDFGSLISGEGHTNENGVALGYGAALPWNANVTLRDGFSVVSDTPDVLDYPALYPTSFANVHAMSFFSRYDGVSGSRGVFYTDHLPYIYKDNAQNNTINKNGASNWVDSVFKDAPRGQSFGTGFHLINLSVPNGMIVNAFAYAKNTDGSYCYGGTRIAEYAVFTNKLTDVERSKLTAYLRAKWFKRSVNMVTVASGASFEMDETSTLAVIRLKDEGAENLVLSCATNSCDHALSGVGAFIHLDASKTNTMTLVEDNGTNFVTRWNDSDGGSMYVNAETCTGAFNQRTEPAKRRPFLNPDKYQNSLPVVDLGSAIYVGYTNSEGVAIGYGGAFTLPSRTEGNAAKVREYLSVISDTEDLKTGPLGKEGPAYMAFYTGNTYNGQNPGRRGSVVAGKNPAIFRKSDNDACVNGAILVNGDAKTYAYNPPDGFAVINLRPTAAVTCNVIGRSLRKNTSGQAADTYGGQRIAEYMLFASVLDDAKRQRIYSALRNKWFGDAPGTTNFYNNLSLGAASSMEVKYEALAVTNKLALAGSLSAPVAFAANVVVTGTGTPSRISSSRSAAGTCGRAGAARSFRRRSEWRFRRYR